MFLALHCNAAVLATAHLQYNSSYHRSPRNYNNLTKSIFSIVTLDRGYLLAYSTLIDQCICVCAWKCARLNPFRHQFLCRHTKLQRSFNPLITGISSEKIHNNRTNLDKIVSGLVFNRSRFTFALCGAMQLKTHFGSR